MHERFRTDSHLKLSAQNYMILAFESEWNVTWSAYDQPHGRLLLEVEYAPIGELLGHYEMVFDDQGTTCLRVGATCYRLTGRERELYSVSAEGAATSLGVTQSVTLHHPFEDYPGQLKIDGVVHEKDLNRDQVLAPLRPQDASSYAGHGDWLSLDLLARTPDGSLSVYSAMKTTPDMAIAGPPPMTHVPLLERRPGELEPIGVEVIVQGGRLLDATPEHEAAAPPYKPATVDTEGHMLLLRTRVFDISRDPPKQIDTLNLDPGSQDQARFCTRGPRIRVLRENGQELIYDRNLRSIGHSISTGPRVAAFQVSPDCDHVAVVTKEDSLELWLVDAFPAPPSAARDH